MQRAARKLGKRIERIEAASLERLTRHDWPGNIRDLQNVIERAAILADGRELVVNWALGPEPSAVAASSAASVATASAAGPAATYARSAPTPQASDTEARGANGGVAPLALRALERQHIVEVLRKTRGVIEGPNGAAQLLRLKPSTARFRIRKLGIERGEYL
jgi:transcriptional regulator with GAF, ATPase, and Fis domain